jgi:hypothetical protein
MNRISQFLYAITNALHIYRRPANFLTFLQTVEPISHYCVRSTQLHMRSTGWHEFFEVRKTRFQIPRWNSMILNFIAAWSVYTSYYVTSTAFMTLQIYYKLKNAQWSDQYSVHKINPDIYLVCEQYVTVKLYRAACSLSDVDWHLFPNERNSCSCSLLNICTTAQQCIGSNVR